VEPELVQVDDGLSRCHVMLFQLQDYASTAAPKTTAVDVDQWLADFLTGQAEGLPEALELNGNLDLDGRTAAMDVQQMGRALANVIRNAAEAMIGRDGRVMALMAGRKPRIHVTTAATARGIEIIVNDNGPGIAPEIIQRIREPLFTTKSFGAGLGLAATDRIMALHGGGMEIASVRGAGARITLWLPDAAARRQAA
jgi:signal transduction histidine kinase